MERLIDEVQEMLKTQEYKLTPKREQVLRVLFEHRDEHLSAEEVYNLVKERVPDVGLATVYRTLELFLNFNIIKSIDFGDGRRRFEFGASTEGHHHHHLICTGCGKIVEVAEDLLDELEERVSRKYKFKITNHEVKIFGLCQECLQEKEKDNNK